MSAEPASNLLRRPGPPDPVPDSDPPKAFDPRFTEVVRPRARLVSLYDQAVFSEGPVWWPARNILVWSDIEGRRVLGQVFSAEGHRLGLIPTPQTCSNCCFGPGERRLFITAQAHLYAIDLAGD